MTQKKQVASQNKIKHRQTEIPVPLIICFQQQITGETLEHGFALIIAHVKEQNNFTFHTVLHQFSYTYETEIQNMNTKNNTPHEYEN